MTFLRRSELLSFGRDDPSKDSSHASQAHESLWSLNSYMDETIESPRAKKMNKAFMITLITVLCVMCLAAIAIPIGVVFGINNKNKNSLEAIARADDAFLAVSGSSAEAISEDHMPSLCSAYSQGGVFHGNSQLPEMYQRSVLNTDLWLDKTDFNLTFTDTEVGGLHIMGLNSSYEVIGEEWDYASRPMKGVNLGGWLVLEPFITPDMFGGDIIDEWTFCQSLYEQNGAARVQRILETHYSTFITEQDFKQIAKAGLDHVRIPFGYWLVEDPKGTPYLPFVGWRYLLRGIEWARKYGLRVFLDLHAVPGSQNGWNHSGKTLAEPLWLNSGDPRGEIYGNQTLAIHRKLATFFSQERYHNLVMFYGLVNEPLTIKLGPKRVTQWHQEAYKIVSEECGFPHFVVVGDGLMGPQYYNQGQFDAESYPKMVLDIHQYMAFDKYMLSLPHGAKTAFVCHEWAHMLNETSMPVLIGEWSTAVNDCGTYVNNVGIGTRWEGNFTGSTEAESVSQPICAGGVCNCSLLDAALFTDRVYRQYLQAFASNQMGIYQTLSWGWMFWTWKTQNNPQWSLKTLLDEGILRLSNDPPLDDKTDWGVLGLSESI